MNGLAGWEGALGVALGGAVLGVLWILDWLNNR